jgi:hypothetical protein
MDVESWDYREDSSQCEYWSLNSRLVRSNIQNKEVKG